MQNFVRVSVEAKIIALSKIIFFGMYKFMQDVIFERTIISQINIVIHTSLKFVYIALIIIFVEGFNGYRR
jgi:TRAP-type C4-dicarboxylate transport system permease small subunit